jgi:hypothetical protein
MVPQSNPDPNDPTRGNPPQEQPMEFPRPPNEPGRKDPRAKPDPAKPSTRPDSDVNPPNQPNRESIGEAHGQ